MSLRSDDVRRTLSSFQHLSDVPCSVPIRNTFHHSQIIVCFCFFNLSPLCGEIQSFVPVPLVPSIRYRTPGGAHGPALSPPLSGFRMALLCLILWTARGNSFLNFAILLLLQDVGAFNRGFLEVCILTSAGRASNKKESPRQSTPPNLISSPSAPFLLLQCYMNASK